MNAPVLMFRHHATSGYAPSAGILAELYSGRPIDLHRMRAVFPDRWSAFLKTYFRNSVTVAFFFSVDEKTARNWIEGTTAPRAEVILSLVQRCPAVMPLLLQELAA